MTKRFAFLALITGIAMMVFAACQAATPVPVMEVSEPVNVPAATEAPVEAAPALTGDAVRGGRLYDKWTVELGVDVPEGDHPLWATQTTNTRSGSDTWRCKECHGWDYKGAEGAYGSGSHLTGFVGVMGVSGKDANEILGILKGSSNPDHDFSAYMDDQALTDLALFLSEKLVDYAAVINPAAGKTFFEENCIDCHGPQGLALNFGNAEEPEYQGTIAIDNPWEFLNKTRFGQPGFPEMPSLDDAGVTDEELDDLLAYVASFPTSAPVSEGGVLYDNWMKAMGVDVPATDQPLFATQTTNTRTGADTWRCKECHGWDYKGVDGAYGSGSHKTGFKGLLDAAAMSAEDLTAWLNGTKNPDHNFTGEGMLGDAQVEMMVAFLKSDKIEASAFVNEDKTIAGGDTERGKLIFEFYCATCHGEDGRTYNFGDAAEPEFVGTVAADNPWEFVHKVNYGQPSAIMPSGINMEWTLQDIIDLLTYAQSLPAN
ncbi:MAG: c-type cytochrome [Chloroflexi bacterium]|nr:c-type cytochrome [Chloroflexota bacterium]